MSHMKAFASSQFSRCHRKQSWELGPVILREFSQMVLKLSELLWLFLNQSDHGLGDFLIKKESNQDLDLYF